MMTRLRSGKESGVEFRTDQFDLNTTKEIRLIHGVQGGVSEDVIGAAPTGPFVAAETMQHFTPVEPVENILRMSRNIWQESVLLGFLVKVSGA
jgi:hypothetical protein